MGGHSKGGSKKYLIDERGRECAICKDYKLWQCFYKATKGARGYSSTCKACRHDINIANNPKTGSLEGFCESMQAFTLGKHSH